MQAKVIHKHAHNRSVVYFKTKEYPEIIFRVARINFEVRSGRLSFDGSLNDIAKEFDDLTELNIDSFEFSEKSPGFLVYNDIDERLLNKTYMPSNICYSLPGRHIPGWEGIFGELLPK